MTRSWLAERRVTATRFVLSDGSLIDPRANRHQVNRTRLGCDGGESASGAESQTAGSRSAQIERPFHRKPAEHAPGRRLDDFEHRFVGEGIEKITIPGVGSAEAVPDLEVVEDHRFRALHRGHDHPVAIVGDRDIRSP